MVRWLTLLCCLLGAVAQAEVLQDPTEPLDGMNSRAGVSASQSAGLPTLQSVMLGNGPALAVLNGKSYRVGQQFDGYMLRAIKADAVVLEKAGKRHTVLLFASKIRG